jgi:hypothetical protein
MARTRPYAGLFDVNLSEGDGIELAEAVLRDRADQPILLYAGFENDPHLADVLSSGVRGVALVWWSPAGRPSAELTEPDVLELFFERYGRPLTRPASLASRTLPLLRATREDYPLGREVFPAWSSAVACAPC